MTAKELRMVPIWKEILDKIISGEYDDYDILVQINKQNAIAPMSMAHVDDRVKTIWFAGDPGLSVHNNSKN